MIPSQKAFPAGLIDDITCRRHRRINDHLQTGGHMRVESYIETVERFENVLVSLRAIARHHSTESNALQVVILPQHILQADADGKNLPNWVHPLIGISVAEEGDDITTSINVSKPAVVRRPLASWTPKRKYVLSVG